jgi:multidrug efflux pump subunit AcrA (membrane-fusion protein)
LEELQKKSELQARQFDTQRDTIQARWDAEAKELATGWDELRAQAQAEEAAVAERRRTAEAEIAEEQRVFRVHVDSEGKRMQAAWEDLRTHVDIEEAKLAARQLELQAKSDLERTDLHRQLSSFRSQVTSYEDLRNENKILKRDMLALDLSIRKLRMDGQNELVRHNTLTERIDDLGGRYLKDSVKWIGASLNANNYAACKQRLLDVVRRCRDAGLPVTEAEESSLVAELKLDFERAVRVAFEREEQARIKAQIREEQQREREVERELKQREREQEAVQSALAEALARAAGEHSAEVERLRAQLAEAEARTQRAVSQAQLTKAGYVYVISNIGSFGEGVFKVGMTRRLEPHDRVRELGDASVPFPFDVHMMISCDDAPALELALHKALHRQQVNKTNPRKEFFRADIESIRQVVVANHGDVEYTADPAALQYRQSLTMSDEDLEFIEEVFDEAEDQENVSVADGL